MTTPFGHVEPVGQNPIQKYLDWAKKHQEAVFVAIILVILIGVGLPYYQHSREKADLDAQNVLGLGQYYQHSPVDPKNGPFKTEAEREQMALQTFQRIVNDYGGTPTAKIARFYVAKDQLAMRQFAQAYSNFEVASNELKGTPLGDEALFGRILAIESQGQFLQAVTLAESFMKDHSTSFIAPEVGLTLADLYAKTQNVAKAKDLLQSLAKTYADSNWGKTAEHRLAGLK
jgi:predicted negative regulator of RcsB-dependent stress response